MAERYTYEAICGQQGSVIHAIAAPALPFDIHRHSPLCGAHFRAEPRIAGIALVTCVTCKRRLEELDRQGSRVEWKGMADG